MFGYIGCVLTTLSGIPQIVKLYKTKSAKDISLIQCLVLLVGLVCWLIYGIQINDMAVILANSISIVLQTVIISLKKIYDSKEYKDIKTSGKIITYRWYDPVKDVYLSKIKLKI